MTRSAAGDCLCGIAVSLHFDEKNRMKGCQWAATQLRPVDRGKLFGLKLKKNHEARQAALKSISEVVFRGQVVGYSARIGGATRGRTHCEPTRARCESAIHAYYNGQMLAFVENRKVTR